MEIRKDVSIRPETCRDYKQIISLVLRSFREGTKYSDGTDIIALIEEIRASRYHIPELSFVAEAGGALAGHFLLSRFPLSPSREGGHPETGGTNIAMLAPVAVDPGFFRQGVGTAMLTFGIEKARQAGFRGIIVEGDFRFYNRLGFRTSSEFGIHPSGGYPLEEPRCQMCMETYPGSLKGIGGYVVYDMYHNA